MPKALKTSAQRSYALADQLSLCSSAILRFRVVNRLSLNDADDLALQRLEDSLDLQVATLRNQGIVQTILDDQLQIDALTDATARVEAFLATLAAAKKAITVGLALISVGQALISGDAAGLVGAIQAVRKATG